MLKIKDIEIYKNVFLSLKIVSCESLTEKMKFQILIHGEKELKTVSHSKKAYAMPAKRRKKETCMIRKRSGNNFVKNIYGTNTELINISPMQNTYSQKRWHREGKEKFPLGKKFALGKSPCNARLNGREINLSDEAKE
ncbi:UNVERIFIED_CONTAM: hypothetical protein NCL1_49810 [Trichonephila clavipes]